MVILVYPNVRNVVVSGQWENNCSNNVPDVLINTQIINTFSSGVLYFGASFLLWNKGDWIFKITTHKIKENKIKEKNSSTNDSVPARLNEKTLYEQTNNCLT